MSEETIERRDTPTRTFMSDLVCAAVLSPIAVVLGTVFTTIMFPFAPIAFLIWPMAVILPISIMSTAVLVLVSCSYFARLRNWSSKRFILTCSLVPSCAILLTGVMLYLYYKPHNYAQDPRLSAFQNIKMLNWGDVYFLAVFAVPAS